jgi:hypothetical protein
MVAYVNKKISFNSVDGQNEQKLPATVLIHENSGDIIDKKNKPNRY